MDEVLKDQENLEITEQTGETEKMLPQSKVNEIVEKRVREKNAKIAELEKRDVSNLAKKYNLDPQEVEKIVEERVRNSRLESLADEAKELGVSPEFLLQIKEKEEKLNSYESKEKAEQEKLALEQMKREEINKQIKEFEEKHPDIDFYKLDADPGFNKFYEKLDKKSITVCEAYEEYVELVGDTKRRELDRLAYKEERSTGGKPVDGSNNYGLDEAQLELCKINGIEPKKFAEDLKKSQYRK